MRYINNYSLYIPREEEQCADCHRWLHLLKHVPPELNEVRVYVVGIDVREDTVEHELPYMKLNGKKKSFANVWKVVMGDTEIPRGT